MIYSCHKLVTVRARKWVSGSPLCCFPQMEANGPHLGKGFIIYWATLVRTIRSRIVGNPEGDLPICLYL